MKIVSDGYTMIDQEDVYIGAKKVESWRFEYKLNGMRIYIAYEYTAKNGQTGNGHISFDNWSDFSIFLEEAEGGHRCFTYFVRSINMLEKQLRRGSEWT